MSQKIIYSLLVFPISKLPLWVGYLFSDLMYLLFLTVFPYRKKYVNEALHKSFPEKTEKEIHQIQRKFYRHLADVFVEAIKNLSISEKELKKRIVVENPEVIKRLYDAHKSVLLVSGHYNNWELVITSLNLLFPHKAVGIGMPLSNPFWDRKINQKRARFGMTITNAQHVKETFNNLSNENIVTLILSDQSPKDARKSYWMEFLNQKTAVLFGCELMAHEYQHAVVYYRLKKIKRGHYSMHLTLITENPSACQWGEITEKHTKLLETSILEAPQYWLWSHKRWKRDIPGDLESLKTEQKKKFNARFNL